MGMFTEMVLPGARRTVDYGALLADGIDPKDFGRMPEGVSTNTPAFVYGHLAIYPARMAEMCGLDVDLGIAPAFQQTLEERFSPGVECVDDADGSKYPSKDELISAWRSGHDAVLGALEGMDESVLANEMPSENMRSAFPTVGSGLVFVLQAHPMMHYGQVSAWRRVMGYGPVM